MSSVPQTNAQRQAKWRESKKKLVEVRTHVKTEKQRRELLSLAKEMRES